MGFGEYPLTSLMSSRHGISTLYKQVCGGQAEDRGGNPAYARTFLAVYWGGPSLEGKAGLAERQVAHPPERRAAWAARDQRQVSTDEETLARNLLLICLRGAQRWSGRIRLSGQ